LEEWICTSVQDTVHRYHNHVVGGREFTISDEFVVDFGHVEKVGDEAEVFEGGERGADDRINVRVGSSERDAADRRHGT
jgi:hypothetical protein